jgi:hypothetical protein
MTMMVDPDQTGCPAHLHRGDGCPTLAASVSMKKICQKRQRVQKHICNQARYVSMPNSHCRNCFDGHACDAARNWIIVSTVIIPRATFQSFRNFHCRNLNQHTGREDQHERKTQHCENARKNAPQALVLHCSVSTPPSHLPHEPVRAAPRAPGRESQTRGQTRARAAARCAARAAPVDGSAPRRGGCRRRSAQNRPARRPVSSCAASVRRAAPGARRSHSTRPPDGDRRTRANLHRRAADLNCKCAFDGGGGVSGWVEVIGWERTGSGRGSGEAKSAKLKPAAARCWS